ncbi:DUF6404 family protein [Stenotrophomonas indicatrix]|uniref:DUF6404 family protein n=1 Tax=Stenotrophomonas indicatrix TaxID=2045451 RepID=UPI0013DB43F1|nr:DUF6404 family protein [Stenotrophomonas indicatrix]
MDETDHRYPADIQVALRFLDRSGVPRREAAPLLHRMLWRLGVALPPPILAGFLTNTLLQSLLFGVFWTVLMWLLLWQGRAPALELLLLAGGAAGVMFGLVMATLMWFLRGARKLPTWRQFRSSL